MEFVILGLLAISDLTIYEINKSFNMGISRFYSQSYGGIQNGIKKLLKSQSISYIETKENGRNKKVYSITDRGREELQTLMFNPVPDKKKEANILTKLYFLGLISDKEKKRAIVTNIIDAYKNGIEEFNRIMDEIMAYDIPEEYSDIFKYQKKTLELGLYCAKREINWFYELLEDI